MIYKIMTKVQDASSKEFQRADKKGKVWLVGAGPSDAGLFTLKGRAVLEQAEVVVYDKLVGQGILSFIPKGAKLIDVGKVAGNHSVPQEEINQILLNEALSGNRVVRLKGGDPFLFGRGGEELELLCQHGIPFEIIPGITSAISVPTYNGIPVTHRDFCSSLHIITGHTKGAAQTEIDYNSLVKLGGTLIFLMGVASLPHICQRLLEAGMDPDMPAAILEKGTTAHQRRVVSNIRDLPKAARKAEIKTPAIIVVGKVCSLAEDFHWAEDRPLGKLKIMVTRPKDRSSNLTSKLQGYGAEVIEIAAIETKVILENDSLKAAIENIERYQWIAFTSAFGVKAFFERLFAMQKDIRSLSGLKFAAIGSATQIAIEEKGILVDLVPDVYFGAALGKALAQKMLDEKMSTGKSGVALIPRAKIGTEEVLRPLAEAGLPFEDLPLYDTISAPYNGLNCYDETFDYVAFTSASTVRGFAKMVGEVDFSKIKAVCIGVQTAQEADKYGMKTFVAERATIDSMVECFFSLV